MAWVMVTCGNCGKSAAMDEFCNTPVNGQLPRGVYQCPHCHWAVQRQAGLPTVTPSGFVMPGKVEFVEVQAYL